MNVFTKIWLLKHFIEWRLTWDKRNTHYSFTLPENPKFMGVRNAVKLIKDGDIVMTSGLAANQRPSIIYWAIREMFQETGHPCNLTFMGIGGIGGRGKAPGTIEEVGLEGLCTRMVCGHLETLKSMFKLAEQGKLELQCIPQGTMALLLDAMANGQDSIVQSTGVGTFIDPRVGTGSSLFKPNGEQFVTVEGDQLRYTMPKFNVTFFNVPAADREGNLYAKNSAMVGEAYESALACKRRGGTVIANVGLVVDKGYDEIFLPADKVDAIVYYPRTEQTGSIYHRKYWSMFTPNSTISVDEGVARIRFVNEVLKITPKRGSVDNALARLGASVFADNAKKGSLVNVGTGLPEEVCRLINEGGLLKDITLFTESGVIGGLPVPGVFFGAAVSPKKIVTSPQIFKMVREKLDCTILGVLEADSDGNINVSKRGEGPKNYVGPGGFIDLTCAAKMIIFVGSWMAHAQMAIEDGKLKIIKPGKPKFIDKVNEITFSGKQAVKKGTKVFYVTNVGVFRLTERGMELIKVMPGVDIQKDIIDFAPMKVVLPDSGKVPVVDDSIVTGKGFKLAIKG